MTRFLAALTILMLMTTLNVAFAQTTRCFTTLTAASLEGPEDYTNVYGNIVKTMVPVKNYRLRTAQGQIINVPTTSATVNLQDLQGFGRGLPLNLANATFPGGAAQAEIIEVEVYIPRDPSNIESANGTSCSLDNPLLLNLYSGVPFTVAKDNYWIKVSFSPLNAVQIDDIMTTTKTECCKSSCVLNGKCRNISGCGYTSRTDVNVKRDCRLANRRLPITNIVLQADE